MAVVGASRCPPEIVIRSLPMMLLADTDTTPLWARIVVPLIPWLFLVGVVWLFVTWQARTTAKILRRHTEAVEAKLDRLIELLERPDKGG
jgi:ATP-dependent Zn protease